MTQKIYDAVIIGSGIAGMTAAIYLKRENLDVIILEREIPGGQLVKASFIENYPGYEKIEGSTLALAIQKQLSNLNVPFSYEEGLEIEECDSYKIVKTSSKTYHTKTILVATGRSPRKLGLEKEDMLYGRGISYCATCDGAFYKNKDVAVVGGGNSAVIESLFLSNLCHKVYLIHRRENLRSESTKGEELSRKENVEVLYETEINAIQSENNKLIGITLTNGNQLNVEGLFIYIGFIPNTSFLKSLPLFLQNEYIKVDENMETNIKGIYACGDVIYKNVYQLTTATGDATIAAESIKKRCLIGEDL